MLPQAWLIRTKPVGLLQTKSTMGATVAGALHPVVGGDHPVSHAAGGLSLEPE